MLLRRYHEKSKVTEEPKSNDIEVANTIAFDEVAKADISKLLTDKGIDHNSRLNKVELYDLLLGSD